MRILFADDHELVRAGIRPFLKELAPDVVVEEADSYEQALALAENGEPLTLAILDLKMPCAGDDGIGEFRRRFSRVPLVILSGSLCLEDVARVFRVGASGYIPKTFGGPAMVSVLQLILNGEKFFPSFALEEALALDATVVHDNEDHGDMPVIGQGETTVLARLSVRERDILGLMIAGGTNKEIARQLEVQEITVKVHLRNIYRKLGAANRAQAVRIALESGWKAA